MNNTMPEEQIEFIENISNYMKASNNMSKEEANDFAFRVWQNERFFKEFFGCKEEIYDRGYSQGRIDLKANVLHELKNCADDYRFDFDEHNLKLVENVFEHEM